LTETFVFNS